MYLLWVLSALFFGGGIFWGIGAAFIPMWAVLIGMIVHVGIWDYVDNKLNENGWVI